MLILLRLQHLDQLSFNIIWRAEVKASHFLDDLLVQWQLQWIAVGEVVFWGCTEVFVHPRVVHDLVQARALLWISDQHARDDVAAF
jgi:hypothetical protein